MHAGSVQSAQETASHYTRQASDTAQDLSSSVQGTATDASQQAQDTAQDISEPVQNEAAGFAERAKQASEEDSESAKEAEPVKAADESADKAVGAAGDYVDAAKEETVGGASAAGMSLHTCDIMATALPVVHY